MFFFLLSLPRPAACACQRFINVRLERRLRSGRARGVTVLLSAAAVLLRRAPASAAPTAIATHGAGTHYLPAAAYTVGAAGVLLFGSSRFAVTTQLRRPDRCCLALPPAAPLASHCCFLRARSALLCSFSRAPCLREAGRATGGCSNWSLRARGSPLRSADSPQHHLSSARALSLIDDI